MFHKTSVRSQAFNWLLITCLALLTLCLTAQAQVPLNRISVDPFTATTWQNKTSVTKSKTTLTGLTSGAKIWVRVRAIGPAGAGTWSDPAIRVAP